MKVIIQVLLWALPWKMRRYILCALYGWEIHPSATIKKAIILAKKLRMDANSRIHNFVICKPIDYLKMGEDSGIATLTFVTGIPNGSSSFSHVDNRKCELILGAHAGITSRHYIDCNGGVYIDDYATIAGIRTQILTHSIDPYKNRQDVKPVRIGRYCFVGTGCVILPGSSLPAYSILGGGSTLNKSFAIQGMIYAGTPAVPKKELCVKDVAYFHRSKHIVD